MSIAGHCAKCGALLPRSADGYDPCTACDWERRNWRHWPADLTEGTSYSGLDLCRGGHSATYHGVGKQGWHFTCNGGCGSIIVPFPARPKHPDGPAS
jgi:hypothetical protein